MAEQASPQLVWQLVKKNNCFLRRNVNNTWFSTEPGNLRGRNSYKYSGLCNDKAVAVSVADDEAGPGVAVTKKTKKGKFSMSVHKGANPRKVAEKVGKDVASYRADLASDARVGASLAFAASKRGAADEDDE